MLIIQRLFYKQIIWNALLVSLGISLLFMFFVLPDELYSANSNPNDNYTALSAFIYSILTSLINLQEIVPISILIATVFVLANLAINSEFTILRTSGLGPYRFFKMLLILGIGFSILTIILSEYITPKLESTAEQYKMRKKGLSQINAKNLSWFKTSNNNLHHIVNIKSIDLNNTLNDINIFSFNHNGFLVQHIYAKSASIHHEKWKLNNVKTITYPYEADNQQKIVTHEFIQQQWANNISLQLIKSSFTNPYRMNLINLYRYNQHLKNNKQDPHNYQIVFWRKIFNAISPIVMLILALPFAYLHFRNSNLYYYIFIGITIGLTFFMIINITEHLTRINHWTPWFAIMLPNLFYSLISIIIFLWLLRNK